MPFKSKYHLIATFIDAGMDESDAEGFADMIFSEAREREISTGEAAALERAYHADSCRGSRLRDE